MPSLALILFAPWFAVLGWTFWNYPRSHAIGRGRRRFDLIALALAVVLSAVAMWWAYFLPADREGTLWPQLLATLAAYHAFLIVLVAAWILRARRFGTR